MSIEKLITDVTNKFPLPTGYEWATVDEEIVGIRKTVGTQKGWWMCWMQRNASTNLMEVFAHPSRTDYWTAARLPHDTAGEVLAEIVYQQFIFMEKEVETI